jgi:transcriptional regulator with XRE-family HTH domain
VIAMKARGAGNPIDKLVGARVRMRRHMLKMSQSTLGDALGLTFQQVQKYENGANRIGASRLHQLAHILQVPVPFFFEDVPKAPGQAGSLAAPSPSYISEFVASKDGLALVAAFVRIKDANLRRRIVQLVEAITG